MKILSVKELPYKNGVSLNQCEDRLKHIAKELKEYKQWFETSDNETFYLFNTSIGYTGYAFSQESQELD